MTTRPTTKALALALALALAFAVSGACADAPPAEPEAMISLAVAPLTLPGVTDARYRVTVTNGEDQTVFSRELTSRGYGDGNGSLSYVGPCDAAANDNTVSLELLALFEGAAGDTPIPTDTYQNPGVLTRVVECLPDADVSVRFDLTVLRQANQGFFDVAVTFDDIFCSAKLDCESDHGPLMLLTNSTGGRDTTAVAGLACTSGVGDAGTWLYRSNITIDCPDPFVDIALDPAEGPGNAYPTATATPVFQYAVYQGTEALSSGGDALAKHYWNVAIGLDADLLPAGCLLTASATAASALWSGGAIPDGLTYPVIDWNVTLTDGAGLACSQHPLNGTPTGVTTRYSTDAESFARGFDGVGTFGFAPDGSPITHVAGVSLPATASVEEYEEITLTPSIIPGDATDQGVTWVSDDTDVATVDAAGVVSGVAEGSATITATTEDGGHTASTTVTVLPHTFQAYTGASTSVIHSRPACYQNYLLGNSNWAGLAYSGPGSNVYDGITVTSCIQVNFSQVIDVKKVTAVHRTIASTTAAVCGDYCGSGQCGSGGGSGHVFLRVAGGSWRHAAALPRSTSTRTTEVEGNLGLANRALVCRDTGGSARANIQARYLRLWD